VSRLDAGSCRCSADTERDVAVSGGRCGDSARNDAGGSKATTKRAARGAPKNAWRCTKKLDSPGGAPYHTPIQVCARSVGAAGALKGQRGSFGRQPSLAPPPRGVAHGVPYYSVFPRPCVHLFLCPYPCWLFPRRCMDTFPRGEKPAHVLLKGYKFSHLMTHLHLLWCCLLYQLVLPSPLIWSLFDGM